MNSYIKIWHKSQNGTLSRVGNSLFPDGIPVGKGSIRRYELGQDDYIELRFSSTTAVAFNVGDLCVCEGGCFCIDEIPYPSYNKNTAGVDYTLKMQADYILWGNHKHCLTYYVTKNGVSKGIRAESEWRLTGSLEDHLKTFIDELSVLGFRHITAIEDNGTFADEAWTFEIDSDLVEKGAKLVEYSNVSIIEGLDSLAEVFECEWWVDGSVLHFGTRILGTTWNSTIRLSQDEEIEELSVNNSKGQYANRLVVLGGNHNIPENYRKEVVLQPNLISLEDSGLYYISDEIRPVHTEYFYGVTYIQSTQQWVVEHNAPVAIPVNGLYSGTTDWDDNVRAQCIVFEIDIDFGSQVNIEEEDAQNHKVFHLSLEDLTVSVKDVESDTDVDSGRANISAVAYWNSPQIKPNFHLQGENVNIKEETTIELPVYPRYHNSSSQQPSDMYDSGGGTVLHIRMRVILIGTGQTPSYNVTLTAANAYASIQADGQYWAGKGLTITKADGTLLGENLPFMCVYRGDKNDSTRRNYIAIAKSSLDDELDILKPMLYYVTIPQYIYVGGVKTSLLEPAKVPLAFYSGDPAREAVRGIAENRLLLPELEGTDKERGYKEYRTADRHNTFYHFGSYIQTSLNLTEAEIVEDVEVIEDEFPRETTESGGETHDYFTMDVTQRIIEREREFSDGTSIVEHIPVYRFKNHDDKEFYRSWVVEGATLEIIFQSGLLAGMTFEVAFNPDGAAETRNVGGSTVVNPASQVFEIVLNENYGRELPDAILFPQTGDKYLLTGWSPKTSGKMSIIEPSEQRLLLKGIERLQERQLDGKSYEAALMFKEVALGSRFITYDGDELYVNDDSPSQPSYPFYVGDPDGEFSLPAVGRRVQLNHTAIGINGQQTRVLGYEYPLDIPFDRPKLLLGMTPQKKRLRAVENETTSQGNFISSATKNLNARMNELNKKIAKKQDKETT